MPLEVWTMMCAVLPPMPFGARLVLGLLGTVFGGLLNLVFRRAKVRWSQCALAFVLSPIAILATTALGLNSEQRTEYVFLGAVVGILCLRGYRSASPLPDFTHRAVAVFVAFAVVGPVMGLVFHYITYQAGFVQMHDDWEMGLSLEDGLIASVAGCMLAGVLVLASIRCNWGNRISRRSLTKAKTAHDQSLGSHIATLKDRPRPGQAET